MGNFCSSCGAETLGGRFCPKCGAPQQPQSQQQPPPVPRQSGGNTFLKIALICLAAVIVLGIVGVVSAVYFVAKKAESTVADLKTKGVDVQDALAKAGHAMETHAGCDLLAKGDAAQILDLKIIRTEGNNAGDQAEYCRYWTDEKSMSESTTQAETERKEAAAEQHASEPDAKQIDDLVKGISVGTGKNSESDPSVLSIAVFRGTGKVATTALKAANLLLPTKSETVTGPWDEAIFGPLNSVLVLRKGDTSVLLDLRYLAHGREKGLALAKLINQQL